MNIVLVTSLIVIGTVLIGLLLAFAFYQLSNLVRKEQYALEIDRGRYNQSLTAGHEITVDADVEEQLVEAKKLAAKRAASLPPGANVRIGSYGGDSQPAASDGIGDDPVSAVKIAQFHTWQGLISGPASRTATKPTLAATQTAPPAKSADDLVPGKDYTYVEITDSMSPAEVRKARIANAKAKSAAIKALSTTQIAAPAESAAQLSAAQAVEQVQAAAAPPALSSSQPVAGVDYQVIDITDDMSPDDIRKARIANSKAKSAAMKAFKEAGGQTKAPAVVPAPAAATEPQADVLPAETAPAAVAAGPAIDIPAPDFIEITNDMSPDEIRKARIQNAKSKSAYIKKLKAAGIDPATVDL